MPKDAHWIDAVVHGRPFTCNGSSQWKFWRNHRIRDPMAVVDDVQDLVQNHGMGFFILSDEELTIHRRMFNACGQELIARGPPGLLLRSALVRRRAR